MNTEGEMKYEKEIERTVCPVDPALSDHCDFWLSSDGKRGRLPAEQNIVESEQGKQLCINGKYEKQNYMEIQCFFRCFCSFKWKSYCQKNGNCIRDGQICGTDIEMQGNRFLCKNGCVIKIGRRRQKLFSESKRKNSIQMEQFGYRNRICYIFREGYQ